MSTGDINFDPLFYGAGSSLAVAVVGTTVAWRALAALPRPARVLAASLSCLGAASIAALLLSATSPRLGELVSVTVTLSAVLQGAAAIILFLLPRRA
ncbi:hypothetical protein [Roseomonas sp. WA12]